MKKIKSLSIIANVFCAVVLLICGCNKGGTTTPATPFQGPQNPSFETNGYWTAETGYPGIFSYNTGTGFLPSQGTHYGILTNYYPNGAASGNYNVVNIYQDGVDFSHSTTMTFDYTFTYAPYYLNFPTTAYVTVQILFTVNGTVTLWQQTVNTATTPIQVKNNTITLPSLPTAGRLLIQLTAVGTATFYPTGTFSIDNIRVN